MGFPFQKTLIGSGAFPGAYFLCSFAWPFRGQPCIASDIHAFDVATIHEFAEVGVQVEPIRNLWQFLQKVQQVDANADGREGGKNLFVSNSHFKVLGGG